MRDDDDAEYHGPTAYVHAGAPSASPRSRAPSTPPNAPGCRSLSSPPRLSTTNLPPPSPSCFGVTRCCTHWLTKQHADGGHDHHQQEIPLMIEKPHLVRNQPGEQAPDETMSIAKPNAFSLDKFKSKHAAALANVETLLTALPHHSISQAKDFVRLHPDEANYWSPELCFVNVPIK